MAPTTATKKAPVAKKAAAHPTFLAMVQEAVKAHPEDSRAGVSRPTIKKYLADTYKIDMSSASNTNNLSNAIKRGSEIGALNLPKGIGGRVKLAVKAKAPAKPAAGKENAPPKAAAKKPAAKPAAKTAAKPKAAAAKPAAKKTAAAKPAAKKPAAKKTSTVKKAPAAKAAAKPAAKKAAPKKTAAKK